MVLSSNMKHALHCISFIALVLIFEIFAGGICISSCDTNFKDPFEKYGYISTILLYFLRFLPILVLPQCICNCLGLLFFNAFPEKIQIKGSPRFAPFISIRVVTRGDYPELVKNIVNRNMNTCLDVGLEIFLFEVVTEKALDLPRHPRVREILVLLTYRTNPGVLFKARNLQYCLEDNVNILSDSDWIVHLDEETVLTENSLRGIINFVLDGKCQFGQGVLTYANENVVNWLTTLADSFRVADDMGKLRFQFQMFHRPLFGWKGSYVVTQAEAERKVSFDHGLDSSVAEDCFFSMVAYKEGYRFNFIEGEMWEKSPFTVWDFLQQRKRWLQGMFLVVRSPLIPFRNKIFLVCAFFSWVTLPLSTSNIILAELFPIPCWRIITFLCTFIGGISFYMYIFGVIKSFSLYRLGLLKFCLVLLGVICTVPINIVLENIAVVWGCLGKKHRFFVVNKDLKSTITV